MTQDSYVLITGASSGIGQTTAIELSKAYNVIIHGRNEDKLKEVQKKCKKKSAIWLFNLENIELIEKELSDFIKENELEISHFVHCAGYMKMRPFKMTKVDNFDITFKINVFSAAIITKTLIHRKNNKGSLLSIVFISSNISNMGAKALSVYASSKGALDSLMRCLAMELAPNIRVNSVLPGAIKTDMTATIFENTEVAHRMSSVYPLGFGTPKDIFEVVRFLLSEDSRWITGQQITVDGGRSINITE